MMRERMTCEGARVKWTRVVLSGDAMTGSRYARCFFRNSSVRSHASFAASAS